MVNLSSAWVTELDPFSTENKAKCMSDVKKTV